MKKLWLIMLMMALVFGVTNKASASGVEVELDILFHKVDSLNYDYIMTDVFDSPVSSIERVEPGFDSGHRLSIRKDGGSGWDYGFTFTSIGGAESDSQSDSTGNMGATQLHPAGYGAIDPLFIVSANAKANFDYETIDLELGTAIDVSSNVAGRYFIGLRVMDLTNEFTVTYMDTNSASSTVDKDLEFSGLGISTGFDTRWRLSRALTINAGVAMSLVAGDLDLSSLEVGDGILRFSTKDSDEIVVNVFDYSVGVMYEVANYKVGIGYEISKIIGLYNTRFADNLLETFSSNADENLSLSGFYIRGLASF